MASLVLVFCGDFELPDLACCLGLLDWLAFRSGSGFVVGFVLPFRVGLWVFGGLGLWIFSLMGWYNTDFRIC